MIAIRRALTRPSPLLLRALALALLPAAKAHCFFWSKTQLQPNSLKGRVHAIQYPANNPIEDRFACSELADGGGYLAAVFDGHGGFQMAQFAADKLGQYFGEQLSRASGTKSEKIVSSLQKSFDRVEEQFLEVARQAYKGGFAATGHVGACALVAVVADSKVFVANAGDCKGLILRQQGGSLVSRKLNSKQNASSKKQQRRLKEQFPGEKDIVVCRNNNPKACYVKNKLQPTRSLGDFGLKYPEFNNPRNEPAEKGFGRAIARFQGPYITHRPEIREFELSAQDKFLVLASDGLWDELSKQEVAQIVAGSRSKKEDIVDQLLGAAHSKAAKEAKLTEAQLRELPLGRRRDFHDDITVVLVELQGQSRL